MWLQFFLVAGTITVAGSRLSKYGDVLAEKTGMGRTWLGLVVLAAVTSLPEMATGVSAVTLGPGAGHRGGRPPGQLHVQPVDPGGG